MRRNEAHADIGAESWLSLLVSPLVWGGRLLAGWTLAETACSADWAGSAAYFIFQTSLTVVALLLVGAAGYVAWRAGRVSPEPGIDPVGPGRFLAYSGVLASALFSILILTEGSTVYLVGCG